jgi:hypothetical protein
VRSLGFGIFVGVSVGVPLVVPERLISLEGELIESLAEDMRSSTKFCKVFIMQGRKLRKIKTTIMGARKGNSQESRGDCVQSRKEEFLVLRS